MPPARSRTATASTSGTADRRGPQRIPGQLGSWSWVGSNHPGGANITLGDGSTRFIQRDHRLHDAGPPVANRRWPVRGRLIECASHDQTAASISRLALIVCCLLVVCRLRLQSAPNLPPQYPVSGTITLDGKPLAGAGIMFLPRGETRGTGAFGMSDAAGQIHAENRSRRPRRSRRRIRRHDQPVVNRDGTPYVPNPDVAEAGERETLPGIYSDSMKTVLTANVPKGGDTINFELKSKR